MKKFFVLLLIMLLIIPASAYTVPGMYIKGWLNMTNHVIRSVGTPINDTDAATKGYADVSITDYALPLAGGEMRGQIDFGSFPGFNGSTPVNDSDITIKSYSDAINSSCYAWTNTTNQTILDYVNTTNQTVLDYTNSSNSSMKDYVDATNQTVLDYVNSSNSSMKDYVDLEYIVMATSSVATPIANNSETILPFATELSDTRNLWNGTAFTAPLDGMYAIDGSMFTAGYTGSAGSPFSASVRINGDAMLTSFALESSGTNYGNHRFNILVYLEEDDIVRLVAWKVAVSYVVLDGSATHNWVTITKV